MKKLMITGICSVFLLTACKKEVQPTAQKSLEQQKIEFQAHQLEIEKQKLAIEKEKIAYEKTQDSIARTEKEKYKPAAVTRSQLDRQASSFTKNSGTGRSSGSSVVQSKDSSHKTVASSSTKKGMSNTAKGTIIGTVGGAAAGAVITKKNRGLGAVVGGIVGGATGYAIGKSKDKKESGTD